MAREAAPEPESERGQPVEQRVAGKVEERPADAPAECQGVEQGGRGECEVEEAVAEQQRGGQGGSVGEGQQVRANEQGGEGRGEGGEAGGGGGA